HRRFMLLKSANPLFFAFSLGLGGSLSVAGQTVIDDFQKGQTTLARAAAGTDSSAVSGAMLGGERDVAVTLSSGSSISAGVALGRFRFNQDAGVTGTAEIVWDGVDGNATSLNPTGLGGVDLTAGGQDAFLLGVNSLDQAATITFTVYSGTTASSSLILPLPGGVTSPNYVSIPFNTFAGSANFGSVGAIRLDISAPGDATLDLDFLRTTSTTFRPSVDATLTDVVLLDNDGNGRASAGDRLKYVVTVKNNSGSTLSNVVFNAPIPASATLVVGSVQSQPVARPDSYPNAVGNSLLIVNAANGVLVHDSDAAGDTLNIAAFDTTSAHGGTVTMSTANGSFTYLPPAGYTGSDTFAYSVSDGHGGAASATVTITISGMVWYVDNAAAPGGDGRSTRPFTSLSALQGAGAPDSPGDYIFVSQGSGPYTSGITLDDNQQLIGQGVDLVVNSQTLVT